jgi:peptide/nickel transport system permease protein
VLTFLARRFVATLVVLLVASYIVYILSANAGDPLAALRESTSRNKAELVNLRIAQLNLDVPYPLRYFIWLGGVLSGFVGHFTLGKSVNGQDVTQMLSSAVGVTVQLLIASTILAIVFGILIGITSALRQYSGYDYTVTFISFLFFSLPSFFVAVILKAYVGIAFNNYLQDPKIAPWIYVVIPLVSGLIWMGILGGNPRRRLMIFAIAVIATLAAIIYISATDWFDNPSLGVPVIAVLGAGLAVLVTALTTGLANRKSLYAALTVVVIGLAVYYPFQINRAEELSFWPIVGLGLLAVAVGMLTGWLWGGYDRWLSARTGGITAFLVGGLILVDRFMQSWSAYSGGVTNGRPIATVGSGTPDLSSISQSFWIQGLDSFTHLLLPTISLMLISLAGYSRYSRANLLDVMNSDYIRTARAKGLNERTVVMRHAFRNSLIPLTTIVAFDFGGLLGGAIITETVFAWSGMGQLFNNALGPQGPDVNALMGFFVVTGIAAVVANILADVAYSALDPRIRVSV